jgi:hypothetical protein
VKAKGTFCPDTYSLVNTDAWISRPVTCQSSTTRLVNPVNSLSDGSNHRGLLGLSLRASECVWTKGEHQVLAMDHTMLLPPSMLRYRYPETLTFRHLEKDVAVAKLTTSIPHTTRTARTPTRSPRRRPCSLQGISFFHARVL